jgi:hypothetical protein
VVVVPLRVELACGVASQAGHDEGLDGGRDAEALAVVDRAGSGVGGAAPLGQDAAVAAVVAVAEGDRDGEGWVVVVALALPFGVDLGLESHVHELGVVDELEGSVASDLELGEQARALAQRDEGVGAATAEHVGGADVDDVVGGVSGALEHAPGEPAERLVDDGVRVDALEPRDLHDLGVGRGVVAALEPGHRRVASTSSAGSVSLGAAALAGLRVDGPAARLAPGGLGHGGCTSSLGSHSGWVV